MQYCIVLSDTVLYYTMLQGGSAWREMGAGRLALLLDGGVSIVNLSLALRAGLLLRNYNHPGG